jgi:pimeloyl-ACP methyl ester carboxylesterase
VAYTVYQLARLANAVYYQSQKEIDGWHVDLTFGNPETGGFFAELFKCAGLWVLAIRGTDEGWDYVPDAEIVANLFESIPIAQLDQSRHALESAQLQAKDHRLALTGHSLGGALALLLAAKADLPVVTFNAPGVALTHVHLDSPYDSGFSIAPLYLARALLAAREDRPRVLNIRANFDVVSVGTGPQLGRVDAIHVDGCSYALEDFGRRFASFPIDMVTNQPARHFDSNALMLEATRYVFCQHKMALMEAALRDLPEYNRDLGW